MGLSLAEGGGDGLKNWGAITGGRLISGGYNWGGLIIGGYNWGEAYKWGL